MPVPKAERKRRPLKGIEQARLVRYRDQRWLEIQGRREALWEQLQLFYRSLGLNTVREEAALGIIETDRLTRTSFFADGPFRLRTRLESEGELQRVFITYRAEGEEVEEDEQAEIEAEVLLRLLQFLGLNEDQAQALIDESSKLSSQWADRDELQLADLTHARARLGIALERAGYVVTQTDAQRIEVEGPRGNALSLGWDQQGQLSLQDSQGAPLAAPQRMALRQSLVDQLP